MEIRRLGHRYWAHGPMRTMNALGQARWRWIFWSDHKWPMFHGSVTLLANDPDAAMRAFIRWLPFEVEVR